MAQKIVELSTLSESNICSFSQNDGLLILLFLCKMNVDELEDVKSGRRRRLCLCLRHSRLCGEILFYT